MALLEARPYRPFKSSEEYLEAMKEDLAEWMNTLYPELTINAENFMDRLDTGVALCKHANYVRQAAEDYLARRQARNKSMTRSITSGSAGPILAMGNVHYLPGAKSGTFFARDNVSNFITWCRKSLKIIECLLFETDDLIMRKNEKHVILCLLEVARRGAKFGMLAPMLVQMERQIDREIAADNKANGIGCGTQTENDGNTEQTDIGVGTETVGTETDIFDDSDTENDEDDDEGPMLMYGPQPQIITNDLKSLDEMVRDLVEKCTCPSQFPMVRVSEGKYRIGDTKVLIFVRILRSHVMVRVGGGWDTLSHYLDKHDPCRCKAQHRSSVAARLIPRANQQTNGIELHKAQVIFERSPPTTRKTISNINSNTTNANTSLATATQHSSSTTSLLSPGYGGLNKNRSPSPTTAQRRYNNNHQSDHNLNMDKLHPTPNSLTSPNLARRSMSPSPRRLIDMRKKQSSLESYGNSGPKSLPITAEIVNGVGGDYGDHGQNTDASGNNKFENISDNGSEISDEGYRSLGVIQSNAQKRESLHSQASTDDAENNARHDQTSSDSQLSPSDETTTTTTSQKTPENMENIYTQNDDMLMTHIDDIGPQSLPAVLNVAAIAANSLQQQQQQQQHQQQQQQITNNKFEQSGVFITDDDITVDIATNTGLRKTGFSNKIFGLNEDDEGADVTDAKLETNKKTQKLTKMSTAANNTALSNNNKSKIPFSPMTTPQRRRSIDNSTCRTGSLQDLHSRTGLPVFSRAKPVYRSVRKPPTSIGVITDTRKSKSPAPSVSSQTPVARDVTNTWSGRSVMNGGRKRPTLSSDTFTPQTNGAAASPFERNSKTRSSHILYDSNGRRIKGCTASLTTSPTKNHANSPLAQQLLEAASSAKNDAQILEKMKTLLLQYSTTNNKVQTTSTPRSQNAKKPDYEDFTTAWVHSNGNLERSSSCSPPTKSLSKRSSAASSCGSTNSRDMSVVVSPRRERGMSKIPAPVRQHTELY
ncbi:GAS2-like protein pickled eggs [Lucilia cuprina]|uniref:GAS2-like protein pickled eggs n=1 Tax=Lucilia cuprina TaxID=7375 RepID=UPI001F065EEF|nr:GAS2-like protein pickled eggs [Lucilia cuprina]